MDNALQARQALEDYWRDRLENAAAKYQAAKKAVAAAQEFQSQVPSPDGGFAFRQALRTETEALIEYKRAVTMFNNLILYDMVPDEGHDG